MFTRYLRRKSIEDLANEVGEAKEMPPLPEGGIPKQWLPSFIRWPIKVFFFPFIMLDLGAQKVARFFIRTPYKKEGHCLRRGNCCHYILVERPKGPFGWLYYLWITQINGFYCRDSQARSFEGRDVLIMGCRHLRKNGLCAQHRLRPMVCRQWPVIEIFGRPQILKGCGYRAVPRKKDEFPQK